MDWVVSIPFSMPSFCSNSCNFHSFILFFYASRKLGICLSPFYLSRSTSIMLNRCWRTGIHWICMYMFEMFSRWNTLHFSERVCHVIPHNHTSHHIWFYLQGAFNFMIFSNIPSHYSSKSLMRLANFQFQNTLRLRYLMLTFQKPV